MRRSTSAARIVTAILFASILGHAAEETRSVARALQPLVDDHTLAGAVLLVAGKEKVLSVETVGYADLAAKKPMRANDVFWIASMSKAMTAAGVMILVDEGKVRIDDDVEKFLPEFKGSMVVAERDENHTLLKPASQRMKVRHLLSHTSGLPFKSAFESGALDQGLLSQRVISYAFTPLLYEPGTKYLYSNAGINTAARIIEVVTGTAFADFMDRRLLRPLGMKETTFWPNERQIARLARAYKPNRAKTDLEETTTDQLTYPLNDRRRQPMPGGGYFSTAADVGRFCRMLIGGGEWGGRRVLSENSVRVMTTDQIGDVTNFGNSRRASSYGFGLGVVGPGRYWHSGAFATGMWMDASRDRAVVLMVQHTGLSAENRKRINEAATRETLEKFE